MTNNINDIDVSECSYYNKDNEPFCCELWDNECEAQNCYFKQCKRLEQENKELKKRQITKNGFICDCEQNAKYRQALEEIRAIIKNRYTYSGRLFYAKDFINMLDDINNLINEVLNDRN